MKKTRNDSGDALKRFRRGAVSVKVQEGAGKIMSCEKECKLGKTYCCMECPSYDICREKRKNRKSSFEKAVKWIAVSIAVIAGIKMTGSAWCLWAFALPILAD